MENEFLKSDSQTLAKAIQQTKDLRQTLGDLIAKADPVAIFVVQQCLQPTEGVGMTLINLQRGLEQREVMEAAEDDLGN